jgi:DNA-directed RNA polymerase specialized sigma24 family protein
MQPSDHVGGQDRLIWLANIYRAYAADLQRYIFSKVGEPFLAEDLTSMVFLKALRWLLPLPARHAHSVAELVLR